MNIKMTSDGKILLCVAILLLALSFCASRFAGYDSFEEAWMALVSTVSLLGAAAATFVCVIDILQENEE